MNKFLRGGRGVAAGQSNKVTQLSRYHFPMLGTSRTSLRDGGISRRPMIEKKRSLCRRIDLSVPLSSNRGDGEIWLKAYSLWPKAFTIIFCVLFSCLLVSPAFGQEAIGLNKIQLFNDSLSVATDRPYNFGLYEGITIKPILSEKRLVAERKRYPKVDFNKFPMQSYKVDDSKIPKLRIGDRLPDSVLDMPLRVVNDTYGRDTITLGSCMDRQWIILDIWTEWCVPCIGSMNKWESLSKKEGSNFTLLGVYASYDTHRAMPEARKKGYESTQIIGPGTLLLTHLFFQGRGSLGPTIWIKDGCFFGISKAGMLNEDDYDLLLSGRIGAIPEYARWEPMEAQN